MIDFISICRMYCNEIKPPQYRHYVTYTLVHVPLVRLYLSLTYLVIIKCLGSYIHTYMLHIFAPHLLGRT